MDADQARRINEILERALDLEGGERDAYLARFDEPTRASVMKLLASCDSLKGFLERSAPEHLQPVSLEPGTKVGAYTIVQAIGSGSGGTVYEAEQESPRRRVALKIRLDPLASAATHRRFREEAEILARLRHPLIAHVYEAGIHEDAPFFALELVPEARTLTEYAEGLSRKQRLQLFIGLCDAVHHGHLKGVVHRDLKPGNILVPPEGDPKIVDFGIARVEGAAISASALVGTPPYMSPEQCSAGGTDIDARADVYSLGVLLYQLLTDDLPHETRGLPITEATRRVREVPPRSLPRTVAADLRAVVDKALQKDREKRYDSAAQLGEDVQRFLRSEPVTARRGGWVHQLRLFGRRHRVIMGAATLLVLVLVAAVIISSGFALRAREAQKQTEFEAYLANIAAADGALRLHRTSEARQHLRQAAPSLRGWEWELLVSRLDRSIKSFDLPSTSFAAFDPVGDRVSFCSVNRAFWAADFESTKVIHEKLLPSAGGAPVYSADSKRLAIAQRGGGVSIRDARTYELIVELKGDAAGALDVAWRPDGKQVAACYQNGTVLAWDLSSLEVALRARADEQVHRICYAPDGNLLAVGTHDGKLLIWDAEADEGPRTIAAHRAAVTLVAFLPDGKTLLSGSDDARLALWDVATGARTALIADRAARITTGLLAPGGQRAVTGHTDGTLTVWDVEAGTVDAVLPGHVGDVQSVTVSPDGRFIVSTGRGSAKLWEMPPPASGQYGNVVRAVAFDAAGERLAIVDWDKKVRVRSLTGAFEEFVLGEQDARLQSVEFSPDGSLLYSGSDNGIWIWDLASRACVHKLESPSGGPVMDIDFDESGGTLGWAGWAHHAYLWDVETRTVIADYTYDSAVRDVIFLPGGKRWAVVSGEGGVHVRDRESGDLLRVVATDEPYIHSAELSRDGRRLALVAGMELLIYEVSGWTLQARHTLLQPGRSVSWGRADERIAVGTHRGIDLIDPTSGRIVLTNPTPAWIWDLHFSPNGEQLGFGTGSWGLGHCSAFTIGREPGKEWPHPLVRKNESVVPR